MRVISLLPAATEMVAALGALGRLVGVTHECDYPPEVRALPRVTRSRLDPGLSSGEIDRALAAAKREGAATVEVDVELVGRLRPDVIIGQAICDVCAVGQEQLAGIVSSLRLTPWVVTLHAHTLGEVFVDVRKVGEAMELRDEADELIAGLAYRVRRVREAARARSNDVRAPHAAPPHRPRVLVLEWLDPPYVAGHWVPELIEIAGGEDVGGIPGARSVTRSWRDLSALAPDLVVVALCGFDVERARRELALIKDRDARTLLDGRVEFLDGNAYTSRPGPRLVDAASILARLIHG
jgi:iron complex transport system substrate-binding protein